MQNINIGIIGAGYIAEEHLKAIDHIDSISANMIYSRTYDKSLDISETYNIPNVAKSFDDFLEKSNELDGILILVSVENMFDVTKTLLPLNIPLLIEKPPALSLTEIEELSSLGDEYKTPNMIGFNRRFYSIYHQGKKIIDEHGSLQGLAIEGHERFWKIKDDLSDEVREKWLYANSSHTIDLIDFFGGEIDEINTFSNSIYERYGDQFVASIRFKSGALGSYISNWYSPGGWSVQLFGEGVSVIFKPLEKGLWIDSDFNHHEIQPSNHDLDCKEGFIAQMECFKNLIVNKKLEWPALSLKSSMNTMRNIERFILK